MLAIVALPIFSSALAAPLASLPLACGQWIARDRIEPHDYRKQGSRLKTVEDYHFGPTVETLTRPMQAGMPLGGGFDYTLFAYPNHHRALASLIRLGQREKSDQPNGTSVTIDCYFVRALAFAPDDPVARMLYVQYLHSKGRRDDAMTHLKVVTEQAGDNALTHYNSGLLYLQLGALPEAAKQAQRATELGFARPELIAALRQRGMLPSAASSPAASQPASSPLKDAVRGSAIVKPAE